MSDHTGCRLRVEELEGQLAAVRRELHRFQHGQEIEGDYICWAMAENQFLRDSLVKYGRHLDNDPNDWRKCRAKRAGKDRGECDCGLAAALK